MTIMLNWWAKDDVTGRAAAGGYHRCDSSDEFCEVYLDLLQRGLAVQIISPVKVRV